MNFLVNPFGVALLVLCISSAATAERLVNLTHLDNCEEHGQTKTAHLTSVSYEINSNTGMCNTIHGKFRVKNIDTNPRILIIKFFKCPADNMGPCNSNPIVHEESMDCKRFVEDDSGPWHMFSSSMSGSKCGEAAGDFTLDYSSLKLEHLVKYLDLNDRTYSRFRLVMDYIDAKTRETWGCSDIHFDLVDINWFFLGFILVLVELVF